MAQVAVTLCVLLWARAGHEADLGRYEDQVLALLAEHSGRVVQRVRVEGGDGEPAEVQILQFASDAALEGYMNDPRRTALADQRDAAIARTDVLRATLL
jgi:antibiotic biosynthesis monooxygenase (ABM) superfamily enzyme